jgi:hypothetical protein
MEKLKKFAVCLAGLAILMAVATGCHEREQAKVGETEYLEEIT